MSDIVEYARNLVKGDKAEWQTLYTSDSGIAEETLMRSGHLVRFFPDYEYGNVDHMEALATIGSVYA